MVSKSSSPGPSPTTATTPAKQARSRKAAPANQAAQENVGRAGSAGGIILEKEKEKEAKKKTTQATTAKDTPAQDETSTTPNKPRRKPRKLNKDPTSTSTSTLAGPTTNPSTTAATAYTPDKSAESAAAAELEALKSRVRGLEAKVEELYKNGTLERLGRSPRRRGKGRKNSSQQQVPTVASTRDTAAKVQELPDDEEEADEELVRLEGELEVARQDLALYRPKNRRNTSQRTELDDDVEEIPRDSPGVQENGNKHVTLSGSYRIPLPASVNTEDLKTIQSGVSAAQNLARGFLEQRRAAAAVRESQNPNPQTISTPSAKKTAKPRPTPKSINSSMEVIPAEDAEGGKKSWSEWIGGYSVAITRAVKSIEHEAVVESQRLSAPLASGSTGPKRAAGAGAKKAANTGKRPGVKTKISGEQVDGLMS